MRTIVRMENSADQSIEMEHRLLRLYGELVALFPSLCGKLLCAIGSGAAESGIAVAASLVGAASLVCDADERAVKASMRRGHLDFVVRTLDEAVRIVKNEVRRARPVSVGLIADPFSVTAEMNERGIVGDVYAALHDQAGAPAPEARDVVLLDPDRNGPALERLLAKQHWKPRTVHAARLPRVTDETRAKWLQGLPKYQRANRDNMRVMWMTDEEYAAVRTPQP